MSTDRLRELFAEAVEPVALGSGAVDVDQVVSRQRRAAARRAGAAVGLAAAVLAAAVAVPVALASRGPDRAGVNPTASATAAPSASPSPSPEVVDRPTRTRQVEAVLLAALSGTRSTGRYFDPSRFPGAHNNGVVTAEASLVSGETPAGIASLTAYRSLQQVREFTDPCVLPPGRTAGRQGAPAPGDVCTRLPQPDGSVVWTWRAERNFESNGTTRMWHVYHLRTNGVLVDLHLINDVYTEGSPTIHGPVFPYSDAQLLGLVTDPRVNPLACDDPDCG